METRLGESGSVTIDAPRDPFLPIAVTVLAVAVVIFIIATWRNGHVSGGTVTYVITWSLITVFIYARGAAKPRRPLMLFVVEGLYYRMRDRVVFYVEWSDVLSASIVRAKRRAFVTLSLRDDAAAIDRASGTLRTRMRSNMTAFGAPHALPTTAAAPPPRILELVRRFARLPD